VLQGSGHTEPGSNSSAKTVGASERQRPTWSLGSAGVFFGMRIACVACSKS
jgi:hypothetical protein